MIARGWSTNMIVLPVALALAAMAHAAPLEIGTRLEPLVDNYLIDHLDGLELRLHHPIPRDVAITYDKPWEGNTSCYVTVFKDADRYRMYYRGSDYNLEDGTMSKQRVCYAESPDGITWTKPELGLVEYEGSTANNILREGIGTHNFAPFKDTNPNCEPEERYKALAGGEKKGLVAFTSPDAIHWTLVSEEPVITKGAFDSQNLAFYDNVRGRYVDFHRGFSKGVRAIMTCTSDDFLHWTDPQWEEYGDTPPEHLYTNATVAYPRAPHIFMAFPKRFSPNRQTAVHPVKGVSDGVFMTSRDGLHWNRWREAFIRPGLQKSRWVNRNNMTAWGMVFTPGTLPKTPDEISLYSSEGYYVGPCRMRRYTIRQDGFVSVHAGGTPGEFLSKAMVFGDNPAVGTKISAPKAFAITDQAPRGAGALRFDSPATIALPDTKDLGPQVTLAAVVRDVPKGRRRLFSAYDGGAVKTTQGELFLDVDPGNGETSIRFGAMGEMVEADKAKLPNWSKNSGDTKAHLVAATWNDGVVVIYFDGQPVGQGGTAGRGALAFVHPALLVGEDYPPTSTTNEPFLGVVDDILVLHRALSADDVAQLAANGAGGLTAGTGDLLLDFENTEDGWLRNAYNGEMKSPTRIPGHEDPVEVALTINYATSGSGYIRCEIQDANQVAIPGFGLDQCDEIYGDDIRRPVTWEGKAELKSLAGKPIFLRFALFDADLYAVQFQ